MDWKNLIADTAARLTVHYTPGRDGHPIVATVVHHNGGDFTTAQVRDIWIDREASAHYQVESSGRVGQIVDDCDTAWHCGNWEWNQKTIGVEVANVGGPDGPVTPQALEAAGHLIAAIHVYYGLGEPQWMVNCFPHRNFTSTGCPGTLAEEQNGTLMSKARGWYRAMTGQPLGAQAQVQAVIPPESETDMQMDNSTAEWLRQVLFIQPRVPNSDKTIAQLLVDIDARLKALEEKLK